MKIKLFIIFSVLTIGVITITAYELRTGNNNDPEYSKTELYFGLSIPGGGIVSAAEWQAFADSVITVSLSDGFTLVEARGQWSEHGKPENEDSKILIVIFQKSDNRTSEQLEIIRAKYKRYFQQESVLRVDENVKASF